jgi:hypothetical protein
VAPFTNGLRSGADESLHLVVQGPTRDEQHLVAYLQHIIGSRKDDFTAAEDDRQSGVLR